MTDRDDLAALMKDRLREVYMTATVERYDAAFIMDDDPLNDVVVDGHVDFLDLADAILTRWRLVPVGNDVKFHADVTEDPLVMVDEHAHEWWSDFHGNVECVHCGQLMPNT